MRTVGIVTIGEINATETAIVTAVQEIEETAIAVHPLNTDTADIREGHARDHPHLEGNARPRTEGTDRTHQSAVFR